MATEAQEITQECKIVRLADYSKPRAKRAGEDLVPFIGKTLAIFAVSYDNEDDAEMHIDAQEVEWIDEKPVLVGDEMTLRLPKRVHAFVRRGIVKALESANAAYVDVVETERGLSFQ